MILDYFLMLICVGEGGGVTKEDNVGEVGEQGERA